MVEKGRHETVARHYFHPGFRILFLLGGIPQRLPVPAESQVPSPAVRLLEAELSRDRRMLVRPAPGSLLMIRPMLADHHHMQLHPGIAHRHVPDSVPGVHLAVQEVLIIGIGTEPSVKSSRIVRVGEIPPC